MTHTFCEALELTCPNCDRLFTTEVWLIVDIAERPDLLERIYQGTLHAVTCPHCSTTGQVDAPLLLYRPGKQPPLLFSPAEQSNAEQDAAQAGALIARLRQALGSAWQEDWLAQGLPGIARPLLPTALSEGPQMAILTTLFEAFIAVQTFEDLRELRQHLPPSLEQPFVEAMSRFLAEPPAEISPPLLSLLRDRLEALKRLLV